MKNMLFIRLGKYLINLPNVMEIYLGSEEDYMEVCYGGDMNNTQIDPDELEEGELERFKACILNLKDENVLFVKLGSYLVNLPHVLEIRFCEEEVEVYYDDDETRAIDKKDIEPNALKELNEHLLA